MHLHRKKGHVRTQDGCQPWQPGREASKGSQSFWQLDLGTPELWEINVYGLSHFFCVCACVWYSSLRKLIYKLSKDLLKGHILIQEVQCRDWAYPVSKWCWCWSRDDALSQKELGCVALNNFTLKPQWQNKVLLLAVYLSESDWWCHPHSHSGT